MGKIVYLCSDLLFTSKIREAARAAGHEATVARDPEALAAAATGAAAAVVDLRLPTALSALAALRPVVGAGPDGALPVIGFCDHERTDLMASARDAGCTVVLAKGRFSSDIGRLLAETGGAAADHSGS